MKKYLITNAQTESEWDSVIFGLVELTPELLASLKKFINRAKELKDEGIGAIQVFADNVTFFNENEVDAIPVLGEDEHQVIELSDDVYNNLSTPEQDIRYGSMVISEMNVTFKGYGKHTDEEFWMTVSSEYILSL